MGEIRVHKRLTDTLIQYVGPINELTGAVLDQDALDASGGSALFRVFDLGKSAETILARTRLRSAVAAAGASLEVPAFTPAFIEAGDTLVVSQDDRSAHESTVSSYTPAAGFDTIVLAGGLVSAAAAGSSVYLATKAAGGLVFPYRQLDRDCPVARVDDLELETDTPATYDARIVSQVQRVSANESNSAGTIVKAPNQEFFDALTLTVGSATAISAARGIRRKLGGDVTMVEYGTPVAGEDTWGFQGAIPDTLGSLVVGQSLYVEVHFDGGPGLKDIDDLTLPVVR